MLICFSEKKWHAGQSILEVLIVIAIFLFIIVAVVSLASRYTNSLNKTNTLSDVEFIAQESLNAVTSISYDSWSSLTVGPHGLALSSGKWIVSGTSDVINAVYTRTITISAVKRNDLCQIDMVSGTIDNDTKKVDVSISWNEGVVVRSETITQYFTNWKNPTIDCVIEEASGFDIDIINARVGENHKSLLGIVLLNRGKKTITIDKMTLSWTILGAKITEVKIEGTNYWKSTGPGTPIGEQPSGTQLDIVNFTMAPAGVVPSEYDVDRFRFDKFMDGVRVTLTILASDGSEKTVSFEPSPEW